MDGIINLIESITQSKKEYLKQFTDAFEEHQSFRSKNSNELEPVISRITNLLGSMQTRYEGLLLLKAFLAQCHLNVLEEKGTIWISLCTKICSQKKPLECVPHAYDILVELLKKSTNIPEIGKALSTNLLLRVIESAVSQSGNRYIDSLKCLEACLQYYPGSCGSPKNSIQKHILKSIDSTNESEVIHAAKCQHLLQQVRGGGVEGISHKNSWTQYQLQLLGTLHEFFDLLFENTSESFDIPNIPERFIISKFDISPEPVEKAVQIFTRCNNLCKYLVIMLLEPFPVSKSIYPIKIMGLITRGLSINCSTLSKNLITDNIAVGSLLPELHVNLFKLLDALILVLKSNMLLYSKSICKIIIQSLNWTNSGKSKGSPKPYISIRIAAYNTLSLWCKLTKYGSTIEDIAEQLISHILHDITPYQNEVTLKVLSGSKKHLSKKARKRLHTAQNEGTHLSQTHSNHFNSQNSKVIYSDIGNEILCSNALDCLMNVLKSSGCFLKPSLQKLLQENIVSLAFTVIETKNLKSNLYGITECRKNLFNVLHSLVTSPHHLCPPPLQYAINIFGIAQINDTNFNIRCICSNYHNSLERILHPQKDFLHYSINPNEMREALKEKLNGNLGIEDVESDSEVEFEINSPTNETEIPHKSSDLSLLENFNSDLLNGKEETEAILNSKILANSTLVGIEEKKKLIPIEIEEKQNEVKDKSNTDDVVDLDTVGNNTNINEERVDEIIDEIDEISSMESDNKESQDEMETINIESGSSDNDDIIQCDEPNTKKQKLNNDTITNSSNKSFNETDKSLNIGEKSSNDIISELEASFVNELNEEIVIE